MQVKLEKSLVYEITGIKKSIVQRLNYAQHMGSSMQPVELANMATDKSLRYMCKTYWHPARYVVRNQVPLGPVKFGVATAHAPFAICNVLTRLLPSYIYSLWIQESMM